MFEMAKNRLDMFQQKYPMKGLATWWTWWEKRKCHVFRAFKPSLNAPRANLAESGHSSWKNSGVVHLDLLDAARQDVAENLQLRANLRGYEQGTYSGGKGPSQSVITRGRIHLVKENPQEVATKVLPLLLANGLSQSIY